MIPDFDFLDESQFYKVAEVVTSQYSSQTLSPDELVNTFGLKFLLYSCFTFESETMRCCSKETSFPGSITVGSVYDP